MLCSLRDKVRFLWSGRAVSRVRGICERRVVLCARGREAFGDQGLRGPGPRQGHSPLDPFFRSSLFEEAIDDLFFRFGFGQTQGHQLDDLFARDFADGRLVDQRGVDMICL